MSVLYKLLVCHFIGDYVLQIDWIRNNPKLPKSGEVRHAIDEMIVDWENRETE